MLIKKISRLFQLIVVYSVFYLGGLALQAQSLDSEGFALYQQTEDYCIDSQKGIEYARKSDSLYLNIDSCLYYGLMASPLLFKTQEWYEYVSNLNGIAYCYGKLGMYEKKEKTNIKSYEMARKYLKKNDFPYINALNNLAIMYTDIKGDYQKALDLLEASYSLAKENKTKSLGIIETNIGLQYYYLGDFETATLYYTKAISSLKNNRYKKEGTGIHIVSAFEKQGRVAFQLKKYKEAEQLYSKAIDDTKTIALAAKTPIDSNTIFRIKSRLARTYLKQNTINKANTAVKELATYPSIPPDLKTVLHHLQGEVYRAKKQYNLAINAFKTALQIPLENSDIFFGESYVALANTYIHIGETDKALETLRKGIQTLCPDVKLPTLLASPDMKERYFAGLSLNKLFKIKGSLLNRLYAETQAITYLEAAIANYHAWVDLTDDIRGIYQSEQSQLLLLEDSKVVFEEAINSCYDLYQQTNKKQYLTEAFFFLEKSKSNLLLDELRRKNFQKIIPDSLVKKEYSLRVDIEYTNKRIREDSTNKEKHQHKLLEQNKTLEEHREYINRKYPIYSSLVDQQQVSLEDVQKGISEKQTILAYFVGNEKMYVFSITDAQTKFVQVKKDFDLNQRVVDFCTTKNLKMNGPTGIEDYLNKACFLYEKLLEPIGLSTKRNQVVILPDEQLENLPFDLLVADNKVIDQIKKIPYLIKEYTISSAYSASILAMQTPQQTSSSSVLSVFPVFEGEARQLSFSESIKTALLNYEGKSLWKSAASIGNFLQQVALHDIIHFTTHAYAPKQKGEVPRIAFSDGDLKLPELQTLNLKANLAVLSACETNVGNYQKGEGIMSLARGFAYAGISSLITSITNVQEKSTSKLVLNLYRELDAGKRKDVALQEAKLTYLKENDKTRCAPYYWGSFLAIGNMEAVVLKERSYFVEPFFLGIFTFLCVVFFRRKSKNN